MMNNFTKVGKIKKKKKTKAKDLPNILHQLQSIINNNNKYPLVRDLIKIKKVTRMIILTIILKLKKKISKNLK